MKKNKFMKLASGLLVLCLMTTCVIGATLAKYTTSNTSSDSAHVAKWGVSITAATDSAFKTEYEKDDDNFSGSATVVSDSGNAVVAPGTTGTAMQFAITGKPEVAVNLTFEMTVVSDVFLKAGNAGLSQDYYPIKYYLHCEGTSEIIEGTLSSIAATLNAKSKKYAAGTDLAEVLGSYTLSWEWAFERTGDWSDMPDTLLGDLIAGTAEGVEADQYSTEVSYTLTITVTQID